MDSKIEPIKTNYALILNLGSPVRPEAAMHDFKTAIALDEGHVIGIFPQAQDPA